MKVWWAEFRRLMAATWIIPVTLIWVMIAAASQSDPSDGNLIVLSNADHQGPAAFVPLGPQVLTATAQGHPAKMTLRVLPPSGAVVTPTICYDTTICQKDVEINEYGLWEFIGVVEYAHEDTDGSPYVYVAGMAATADPKPIFSDGFEDGTTNAWSQTQGG